MSRVIRSIILEVVKSADQQCLINRIAIYIVYFMVCVQYLIKRAGHRNSDAPTFTYTFSKLDYNRFVQKGRNGRRGVFEIIDGGVAVRPRCVHFAQRRVIIQHALLRFGAVIENERSCNANPFVALHGAEFYFGVRGDLLCYALAFARLDIQFAFKQMYGAERPHARLVSFDGGKIVCFDGFQKVIDLFHKYSS